MNIKTKEFTQELDKPLNNKDLRRGQAVWCVGYGLCIVTQENKAGALFLVNLSSGGVYPLPQEDRLFDMDKYYEFNTEYNYPRHFEQVN